MPVYSTHFRNYYDNKDEIDQLIAANDNKRIYSEVNAMINKNRWIIFSLIVLSVLNIYFLTGCAKKETEIKIGAILPLTGSLATYGEVLKNSMELATDEINQKGGINGTKIKLLFEDSTGDPKTGISAFQKLMATGKPKVVVTTVSSVALALVPLAEKDKIVLFAEVSHPKISGISPYVFRHSNTAIQDAQVLADYIENVLKLKKVGLIVVNDDYGQSMRAELKNRLTQTQITQDLTFEKTEMDFRSFAALLIADKPDGIIIVGYGQGLGNAFKRIRELGYKGELLTGFAFGLTKDAATAAGEAAKGIHYPSFAFSLDKGQQVRDLEKRYMERFGSSPNDFLYIEYDTMKLIFEGINAAGYDAEKIKDYLRGLGSYSGITGEISILESGDILSPVKMRQYD